MKYLLTFDIGTTAVKVGLYDELLNTAGFATREYRLLLPQPGTVEMEPEAYWQAMKTGLRDALQQSGAISTEIIALTVTTQGETLLPVNREGVPLCNAIVWMDTRASEEAAWLNSALESDEFYRHTGHAEASSASPVCKVMWLKRNRPELFACTHKILLLEDYLLYRLTGRFVTERSLMTSTGYFDITSNSLWQRVLALIGIEPGIFPEILRCGERVGALLPDAAADFGLSTDTVVCTGAMDQAASALGAGNIATGIITETTGTALVVAAMTREPDFSNPAKLTIYRNFDDNYLYLSYQSAAGILLKWFKDEFCQTEVAESERLGTSAYDMIVELAAKAPIGANGLLFLPDITPAPAEDCLQNKGVFYGIGLDTRRHHFIRAILESVAFMLRACVRDIEAAGGSLEGLRSLGGGASSRIWSQIKADVLGKEVIVMARQESTSLGAAILAAVCMGFFSSIEEACNVAVKHGEVFQPDMQSHVKYDRIYNSYSKLLKMLSEI